MSFFQQNRETSHTANNLLLDPECEGNYDPLQCWNYLSSDTASQHCYKNVQYHNFKHYLQNVLGDRITSWEFWPPCLPALTLYHSQMRGTLTDKVYINNPHNEDCLRTTPSKYCLQFHQKNCHIQ
jgi:hypothetical protein